MSGGSSPVAAAADDRERRSRFETAALPLSPALFRFAARLTRDQDAAADLVQEAFLRAYRTFANFRTGTNAKAWLFQIVYSVFVNVYRKRQREPTIVSVQELEARFERSIEIPDWSAYREVFQNPDLERGGSEVARAVGKLPESFRLAVVLVDMEELTYEEAAEVMGCPTGTLRSRLFRGRRLLALELEDYARQQGYLKGPEKRT